MQDRVPVNPGRVLITPEDGSAAYYATMTRADNPTQEGDPLNKNTFLKDTTAALFGLGTGAVPDDVLVAIKSFLDGKSNNGHVHDASNITSGVLPVARGGTGVTSLTALVTAAGAARIATGTYTGNGKYMQTYVENKRSLTFSFAPAMLILWKKQTYYYEGNGERSPFYGYVGYEREPLSDSGWSDDFIILVPLLKDSRYSSYDVSHSVNGTSCYVNFNGNTVEWYASNARDMFNTEDYVYGYIAIG